MSLVFIHALTGLHRYRGGSFAAWLFRIAHNSVANHLRSRQSYRSLEGRAAAAAEAVSESEEALDSLVREEERQQIAQLIAALPKEQRELLLLRVVGDLSATEAGAVLGKSEGAVRVALHRIVQQLRRAYQQTSEE